MLSRIRVLDLTDGGAGLCGQVLADLGADVLLVEPPGGAPSRARGPFRADLSDPNESLAFWSVHRGKRSLVLDLAARVDRERLRAFASRADLLIEAHAPGALAALGLGHAELARVNPRLITVSITPFGQSGPKAHWAATDLTVTAASMALYLTGDEDRPPVACSVPQAFLNAGAEAAVGALIALHERERSGEGQQLDVSTQASMMMTTQSMVLSHGWNDAQIRRVAGGVRIGEVRLRFVYACKDGYVNFTFLFGSAVGPCTARMFAWLHEEGFVDAATRDKDWVRYGELLASGTEPLSELARVTAALEAFTRSKTKAELYAGAFTRRVLVVPLSDALDLAASSQLAARNYWTPLQRSASEAPALFAGPFAKLSATPIRYERPPPRLDEHGDALRAEADLLAAAPAETKPRASARVEIPARPFEGLKVLDFSWAYAGPAIGRYLADYGATVVRVESQTRIDALRPGQPFKDGVPGFERSGNYSNINVGKLGLGLNLKAPGARDVARRLARWADVVIENFSPGVMTALGLDYASLSAEQPALVMLSTCLMGASGPEARLAGYGTMGAALAGFGYLTGWPDRAPSAPFLAYSDYTAPKLASAALLAALDHRRRTGQGQHIDVSQAEAAMHLLGVALLEAQLNGRAPKARGNALHYAPSGVYPCAGEDRWLALAAPDDASWRALADVLAGELASDVRFTNAEQRVARRAALDAAISARTAPREVAELEAALQAAGVPAHRVSTSADVLADAQLAAREHLVWREHPQLGTVPLESSRLRFSRSAHSTAWPGPLLGQHNFEVLADLLGMNDEEIARLAESGALE